jgi:hypothetical protein
MDDSYNKRKKKKSKKLKWRKYPPKIEVIEVEPIPTENLEVIIDLIKKATLRKLNELKETQ